MEDKVRVFEIAEEAGSTSAEVIKKAADLAIVLKSPQSSVSFEEAEEIAGYIMTGKSKLLTPKKVKPTIKKATPIDEESVESTTEESKIAEPVESTTEESKVTKIEETVPKKVENKKIPLKRNELKIVQKKNVPVVEPKVE